MDLQQLHTFLGWCLVFNVAILLLWFLAATVMSPLVYRVHGRLLNLTEQEVRRSLYLLLGQLKMLVTIFNLAPWLALWIMLPSK